MSNVLLIYPEVVPSYWSAKYALEFIKTKAAMPPLGLLTLAALFPSHCRLKLIDMNVEPLLDEHLDWADFAFLSAMIVQRDSFADVVERCRKKNLRTVAGGPYPTAYCDEIPGVDYFVLGEVEEFFAEFVARLENGTAPHVTKPAEGKNGLPRKPDMSKVAPPRYDLVDLRNYGSVALQFSRGCPFDCEFCDITQLYGRVPRTKTDQQMLTELQMLYDLGWRRTVFFVDDNFIGHKSRVKHLLHAITAWQKARRYPFCFYTEASVNLADSPELMEAMADAGFDMVFLGLETPNPNALRQANKQQNTRAGEPNYLLEVVRRIQHYGMEVSAGFILGLDGDDLGGFDAQVDFIQHAGIPTAMVGLLVPLKGTRLYERYKRQGRLLNESSGNNVCVSVNYIPEISGDVLISGYKRVLASLYDANLRNYFARCYTLLLHWNRRKHCGRELTTAQVYALLRSFTLQLFSRQGPSYARFLARVLLYRPKMLGEAVRLAIMGYHYEKVTREQVKLDEFKSFLTTEYERLQGIIRESAAMGGERLHRAETDLQRCLREVRKRYQTIHKDFHLALDAAVRAFLEQLKRQVAQYTPELDLERLAHALQEPS